MTPPMNVQATLEALEARIRDLEDRQALAQLIASYGPAVDSGSAEAAADLWSEDGVFDVVPHLELTGHESIAGMVNGAGHQALMVDGCGHVLTAPRLIVDGDYARGWNYAANVRWDNEAARFWIARLSANEWLFRREIAGWRVLRRTAINLDGSEPPRGLLRKAFLPTDQEST